MTPFSGIVWRIMFADGADDPLAPARAPEGRFHYDGQRAIYTSLTPEGASSAIQRYLSDGDPPRVIIPLRITAVRILDLRDRKSSEGLPPPTSVVWQDQRAQGLRATTWDISDEARRLGAQGILYPARTRPDLDHLVIFGPPAPGHMEQADPGREWRNT